MKAKEIDTYINWFFNDNSNPYEELRFLIGTIMDSDKKHIIEEAIKSVSE